MLHHSVGRGSAGLSLLLLLGASLHADTKLLRDRKSVVFSDPVTPSLLKRLLGITCYITPLGAVLPACLFCCCSAPASTPIPSFSEIGRASCFPIPCPLHCLNVYWESHVTSPRWARFCRPVSSAAARRQPPRRYQASP